MTQLLLHSANYFITGFRHPYAVCHQHRSGHLKVNSRHGVPYKGIHLHRAIAVELLMEATWPHPQWGRELPDKVVVHHMDHNPHNNHPGNLVLMDWRLHSQMSCAMQRGEGGKWGRIHGRRLSVKSKM